MSPQAVFEELKIHILPEQLSSWPLSHMELLDLLVFFSGPLQSSFGPCAVQVTASKADKCPVLLQLPLLPHPLMVTYTKGSNFTSKGGSQFFYVTLLRRMSRVWHFSDGLSRLKGTLIGNCPIPTLTVGWTFSFTSLPSGTPYNTSYLKHLVLLTQRQSLSIQVNSNIVLNDAAGLAQLLVKENIWRLV